MFLCKRTRTRKRTRNLLFKNYDTDNRLEAQKKSDMRTFELFSCLSSSFSEKKEIRKRQGRYKGRHIRTKLHNTDPEHVTSETVITGSNRESIYYLLNLRLLYYFALFYLYDTGSVYYTNIQYTQLLYWACLIVHIYYSASLILGYSIVPELSDLIPFYWVALVDRDFIISPLFSMVLSFVFGSLY